jgi:hypothetical protein
VEKAERDADGVKAPRRHHEADAVKKSALPLGKLGPVRVAVEDGDKTDDESGHREGRPGLGGTRVPRTRAEMAIPTSTPGRATPMSPSVPPKAITMGKVTGRIQTGGGPS